MSKEIYKKNLYGIIGVPEVATEKEILKGYRKRALKCHPDKNPDNPKAAELFHELSQALEILTDPAARAAYDQSLKAKKAAEARNQVLDSKRKKFKEDLEAREKAVFEKTETISAAEAEKKLKTEIERLRREGSRLLEQEQERLHKELKRTSLHRDTSPANLSSPPRIKLKWKTQKNDSTNGGYNTENLKQILGCYGKVNALLVSSKCNGSAIVEFDRVSPDILSEHGHHTNPLTLVWLSGKPEESCSGDVRESAGGTFSQNAGTAFSQGIGSSFAQSTGTTSQHTDKQSADSSAANEHVFQTGEPERDFESLVLMRMRQAEERKKLIKRMMEEENAI